MKRSIALLMIVLICLSTLAIPVLAEEGGIEALKAKIKKLEARLEMLENAITKSRDAAADRKAEELKDERTKEKKTTY